VAIKKMWYDITAPAMFGSVVIGQTLAAEPKQIIGRRMWTALPDMGVDSKKFYIKIGLTVDNVDGTKATTKAIGHECVAERICRMVQRYTRRVDCIQDVKAQDATIRVKTVLIIPRRVGTAVKDAVRAKLRETVEELVSKMTTEEFLKSVIDDKLQLSIRNACKKIYPVGMVEIRKSEIAA